MSLRIHFISTLLIFGSIPLSNGVAETMSTRDKTVEKIAATAFPTSKSGAVVAIEVSTGKVICLYSSHEGDQPSEKSEDTISHAVRAYHPGSLK